MKAKPTIKPLYFENPHDRDNVMVVSKDALGALTFSVSDLKSVGSYNDTFECAISLTKEQVVLLHNYLKEIDPPQREPGRPIPAGCYADRDHPDFDQDDHS